MRRRSHIRYWTHAAIIAALYTVLTHLQNIILPNSASMAIQCRLSEALCVLALFTPAAIPGLAVGCLVFNLTFAAALPLDFLAGTAATILAAIAGLIYVVNPMDIVPEYIIGFGVLDDAAVVGIILQAMHMDLNKYKKWQKANGKR